MIAEKANTGKKQFGRLIAALTFLYNDIIVVADFNGRSMTARCVFYSAFRSSIILKGLKLNRRALTVYSECLNPAHNPTKWQ